MSNGIAYTDTLMNEMLDDASTSKVVLEQLRLATQLKFTSIIIATLPILVVYPLVEKHFGQGMLVGSFK